MRLCVCSHAEASECYLCQESVLFYEADQTQGVIVIYEAPRCLWRVQLDQKIYGTLPSTQCLNIMALIVYITLYWMCSEHNSTAKRTFMLFEDDSEIPQRCYGPCALCEGENCVRNAVKSVVVSQKRCSQIVLCDTFADVKFTASTTKDRLKIQTA